MIYAARYCPAPVIFMPELRVTEYSVTVGNIGNLLQLLVSEIFIQFHYSQNINNHIGVVDSICRKY